MKILTRIEPLFNHKLLLTPLSFVLRQYVTGNPLKPREQFVRVYRDMLVFGLRIVRWQVHLTK